MEREHEPQPAPAEQHELDPEVAAVLGEVSHMTPGEVMALRQKIQSAGLSGDIALQHLDSLLTEALEELPKVELEHAAEVFRTFTESTDVEMRQYGAAMISALTPYDHDLGYELWLRLAGDPDSNVRNYIAEELVGIPSGSTPAELDAYYAERGITHDEVMQLLATMKSVESGGEPFDLGQSVFERVKQRLDSAGDSRTSPDQ